MNIKQRALYDEFRANPPTVRNTGLGQAYWFGFDHPFANYSESPRTGDAQSLAYAAFRAGQKNARDGVLA